MAEGAWHELTAREGEVLAAVGQRLTNAEIAADFHLSVRTVESHIASLRRKLGVDSRSGLIRTAAARRGSAVQVPHNSFVGRDADVAAVRQSLEVARWVTVVGPGGCGKTRLALEIASLVAHAPVVAELEHSGADNVVSTVGRAVGVGAGTPADIVAACGVALSARPHLLVLDNADRVTDAVGAVVSELLSLSPSLRVLITSRGPVGGSDETVYPLETLPPSDDGAIALFRDRARAAAPGTSLADADRAVIAAICQRLDGLPLAIELAAARVRHLPLSELAERLDHGFESLDRAGPDGRHRTLESAFDWTWDLLDDDEQAVLARLAALPRTFDLELVEAVTEKGAAGVVLRLLDRSLVSPASSGHPRRFRLLAVVRAFVLAKTEPTVVADVRRRHADFYATVAGSLANRARVDDTIAAAEASARIRAEVVAAIDWAIGARDAVAVTLARSLAVLVEQYGGDVASLDAIARAARDPDVRRRATAPDLLDMGSALGYGDLDLVADIAHTALREASDDEGMLAANHLAGYAAAYRNDGATALAHFDVAAKLADNRLDLWQLASVHQGRGIALRSPSISDALAAISAFEAAMRAYALAGDPMHVNNSRYMMASIAAESGERADEARMWAEQCEAYARGSGNRHEVAHALLTRALLADPGDAEVGEAVDIFRAVGDMRCMTRSYVLLARDAATPRDRVGFLAQALEVSRRARDENNQRVVLERLVAAQWEADLHREAAVSLGMLAALIGEDDAVERAPPAMRHELDVWAPAIVEGQARHSR